MPHCSTRSSRRRKRGFARASRRDARATRAGCARSSSCADRAPRAARAHRSGRFQGPGRCAPSGKLVFEARHVTFAFGAAAHHRGFLRTHHARRSHRHHGPQRLRQEHADQTSGGRACSPLRARLPRYLAAARLLRPTARVSSISAASIMDNVTAAAATWSRSAAARGTCRATCATSSFRLSACIAPVSMLSGGERNRLLLARLFARPSNLLVMDEPTNDLDAETLDLLEEMVATTRAPCCWSATTARSSTTWSPARWYSRAKGASMSMWGGTAIGCVSRPIAGARTDGRKLGQGSGRLAAVHAPRSPATLSYKEQRELDAMPARSSGSRRSQAELQAAMSDPELFRKVPMRAPRCTTGCNGSRRNSRRPMRAGTLLESL
jgi:hypothetical protein